MAAVTGQLYRVTGVMTIRAAILVVLWSHAVARRMRAFFRIGHNQTPPLLLEAVWRAYETTKSQPNPGRSDGRI